MNFWVQASLDPPPTVQSIPASSRFLVQGTAGLEQITKLSESSVSLATDTDKEAGTIRATECKPGVPLLSNGAKLGRRVANTANLRRLRRGPSEPQATLAPPNPPKPNPLMHSSHGFGWLRCSSGCVFAISEVKPGPEREEGPREAADRPAN
eukprot:6290703-Pyramimonas_sp.AAC.1